MRSVPLLALGAALLAGGYVAAARGGDAEALRQAQTEAAQAKARYEQLSRQALKATDAAERARAEGEALAANIEAAEAELTVAERRISIVDSLQAEQRVRLAARQQPLIRLTAALQTMARRPPALALVQPGSVRDTAHVRSLLAAALPEIRRRTAALRAEVRRGAELRRHAEQARAGLLASRQQLQRRRVALARFEAEQRSRSEQLAGLALTESDRALVFGEEARALASLLETREYQAQLGERLADLPGPVPRPGSQGEDAAARRLRYRLPLEGRLITGVGEISDGGVHSRGLTFAAGPQAPVVAPAAARIAYAAPFRSYGHVVILDHGNGLTTVITDLAGVSVARGQRVAAGALLGRTGPDSPRVTVELRRGGRPIAFAQLISG